MTHAYACNSRRLWLSAFGLLLTSGALSLAPSAMARTAAPSAVSAASPASARTGTRASDHAGASASARAHLRTGQRMQAKKAAKAQLTWPSPAARGLQEVSGLLHFHSPYSHDACDGNGLDDAGNVNQECLADLRHDVCVVPHRFFFITDHPSNMSDQVFQDLYLYDPARGDRLVYDDVGNIIANAFTCSTATGTVTKYFMVGTEGNHNLLIGLDEHLEDHSLYSVGFGIDNDYNAQVEEVAQVRAAGGMVNVAHLEEDEVTSYRLLAIDVDGVELYNAHSNVENVMYRYPWVLLNLEDWIEGAVDAPTSDYVALAVFPYRRMEPEVKWDEMTPVMPTTAVIGTDVHQNVTLDAYCQMPELAGLCERLSRRYPNLIQYLSVGGPIPMADGERLDSYRRMSSWFSNHIRTADLTPQGFQDTLTDGSSYISFDILGMPENFDFVATSDGVHFLEMGGYTSFGAPMTLHVALPTLAKTDVRGETWTTEELSKAVMRGELVQVTADGAQVIQEISGAGSTLDYTVAAPGVYRVRVYIKPKHLTRELGSQPQYARDEYLWIWSNPIYIY